MTRAHPLPEAALDGDIAILGRKGGGKTVTAKGIVERLLDLQRRVVILDPLGGWTGLRTSADGKRPGYPVAVFGGESGDLPLDPGAATALAAVLAAENLPAVLDLSDLSKTAQGKFVGDFLHELRRVNRDPLTLVLEEADVFAPQNPARDETRRVHDEVDWIARRGRARGFRLVTITQRPARLSKDVLTQAATLIAHRLPAPQDRDAVKAWVEGNGDRDLSRQVFDTLAGLEVGEAWVYAPEHDLLARRRFPMIRTLDSTATPKAGETRIRPKTLAQVDVSAIRAALAEAAPADAAPAGGRKGAAGVTLDEHEHLVAVAYERGVDNGFALARQQIKAGLRNELDRMRAELGERLLALADRPVGDTARAFLRDLSGPEAGAEVHEPPAESPPEPAGDRRVRAASALAAVETGLSRPQAELLTALRWWADAGHDRVTRAQLAAVLGWKLKGSHLRNRLSELTTAGMIAYPAAGRVALTSAGRDLAPPPVNPADLHTYLRAALSAPQRQMFDVLVRHGGDMSRRALAAELRWGETGSHLRNRLSELKGMEIVTYPKSGRVALQAWVTEGA